MEKALEALAVKVQARPELFDRLFYKVDLRAAQSCPDVSVHRGNSGDSAASARHGLAASDRPHRLARSDAVQSAQRSGAASRADEAGRTDAARRSRIADAAVEHHAQRQRCGRRSQAVQDAVGQSAGPYTGAKRPARGATVFLQRSSGQFRHGTNAGLPVGAADQGRRLVYACAQERNRYPRDRGPDAAELSGRRVWRHRVASAGNRRDDRRRPRYADGLVVGPRRRHGAFLPGLSRHLVSALDRGDAAHRHRLGDGLVDADGRSLEHSVGDVRRHAHRHGRLRRPMGDALRAGTEAWGRCPFGALAYDDACRDRQFDGVVYVGAGVLRGHVRRLPGGRRTRLDSRLRRAAVRLRLLHHPARAADALRSPGDGRTAGVSRLVHTLPAG